MDRIKKEIARLLSLTLILTSLGGPGISFAEDVALEESELEIEEVNNDQEEKNQIQEDNSEKLEEVKEEVKEVEKEVKEEVQEDKEVMDEKNQANKINFHSEDFRKYIVASLNIPEFRLEGSHFDQDPNSYIPTKEDMELLVEVASPFTVQYFDYDDIGMENKYGDIDFDLSGITKVDELKYAKNLKIFRLYEDSLKDISGLENLKNLEQAYFASAEIDNLSVLKTCSNLKFLDFTYSNLENLDFLKGLKNLESLTIAKSNISELTALSQSTKLEKLEILNSNIRSLKGLENLSELQHIDLTQNHIESIDELKNLKKLKKLTLSYNKIEDIEPLKNLVNLESFSIEKNKLKDIQALRNLKELKEITIRGNMVYDCEPLKDLTDLRYLHLYENRISDISSLKNLVNLKEFNFSKNKVKDASVVKNFKKLEVLQARENFLEDLSFINDITKSKKLEVINVSENNVLDISSLKEFSDGNTVEDESTPLVIDKQRAKLKLEKPNYKLKNNKYIIETKNPLILLDGRHGRLNPKTSEFKLTYKTDKKEDDTMILEIDSSKFKNKEAKLYSEFDYKEEIKCNVSEWDFQDGDLVQVTKHGYDYNGDLVFYINLGGKIQDSEEYDLVDFSSEDLRKLIVKSLNNDDNRYFGNPFKQDPESYRPTKYDMMALKTIDISQFEKEDYEKIDSLKGLENAIYLTELKFSSASLKDISALEKLRKIQVLDLSNNKLQDLTGLRNMVKLKDLNIANNPISSLDPLKDSRILDFVDLTNTKVEDIRPLGQALVKGFKFKDLENHWSKEAIDQLSKEAIFKGIDNKFMPEKDMTRAEFLTSLDRIFKFEGKTESKLEFKDIAPGKWYTDTVGKFASLGLVDGYQDGNFRPNQAIKREEMIKIFIASLELSQDKELDRKELDFKDLDQVSSWALESMEKANSLGLIKGYEDQSLKARNNIKRGEAGLIFHRFINNKKTTN